MKLYLVTDCPHCEAIQQQEGINIEKIYVDAANYTGFKPDSLPILQTEDGLNFQGKDYINMFIKYLKNAKDGLYSK